MRSGRRWTVTTAALVGVLAGGVAAWAQTGSLAGAARKPAVGAPPYTQPATSAGPLADSCGVPPAGRGATPRTVPDGAYPVALPPVSHLGARNDLPNPFGPGEHWGRLPPGRRWGSTAGVYAAPDGTIWAIDRCGASGATGAACATSGLDPILQFDTTGKLLKSFGNGQLVSPHKISLDRDGNVWVADNGTAPGRGHQVLKFSPDGTLLLELGKAGVAGSALDEFDQPADVAVAANGDIFVADGHGGGGGATGNARIVKFDKTGKFLTTWGKKGMGPGEFDVVHALAIDSRGRLFVADRQNNRIQVFSPDGVFIAQWFQFGRPSGLFIDAKDTLYVADSESRDGRTRSGEATLAPTGYGFNPGARRGIRIGSARTGRVTGFVPDPCPYPYQGTSSLAEGVTVDRDGHLYGADYLGTIRKFPRR